jgi:hypothetical protein
MKQSASEGIRAALTMMASGVPISAAAKAVGIANQTLKMAWYRYVVEPEWKALKEGREPKRPMTLLVGGVDDMAERARLKSENAWLRARVRKLETTPLRRESEFIRQLRQQIEDLDEEATRLGSELADRDLWGEIVGSEMCRA